MAESQRFNTAKTQRRREAFPQISSSSLSQIRVTEPYPHGRTRLPRPQRSVSFALSAACGSKRRHIDLFRLFLEKKPHPTIIQAAGDLAQLHHNVL